MRLIFLKKFFPVKKKISEALCSKGLVFLLLSNFLLTNKGDFFINEYHLNIVFYFSLVIIYFFYFFFFKFIRKINIQKFSQLFIIIIIIYLISIFFKNFLLLINLPGYSSLGEIFYKFISFFFKNIYLLILAFVLQYLIIFIIVVNSINKIYKIIKILNISGYVFFVLFFLPILIKEISSYSLEILTNRGNNEIKKTQTETSNILVNKGNFEKQVVWIVFDEFDPQIAFGTKYKKYLENFEKLKENSFYASRIYPPAKNTIESIPAQLIGIHTDGNIVDSEGSLFVVDSKDKKKIEFNYKNSLFYKLNKDKFTTAIYSSVINYCKYIGNYKCQTSKLFESQVNRFEIFFIFFSHINPLQKITSFRRHITSVNKESFTDKNSDDSLMVKNHKDLDIDFKNHISIKKTDIKKLIDIDKITDELNSGTNLIFVHILIPHLPSTYSENIFNIKPSNQLEKYIANLKLSDLILKSLLENIVQIKNKEVMLITSSDHWLRAKDININNYYPALLIAKIIKDDTKIEFNDETNLIYLGNLIHKYLKNEISSHKEIENFFYSNIDGTPPYIQPK